MAKKRRSAVKRRSAAKRPSTARRKAATKKVKAAEALRALRTMGAHCKPVGQGKINLADLKKFMDEMKKKGIPHHRIHFVALNAPFMRRSPASAV